MENISYENYLKCKDALSFEYCQKIHQAILLELGTEPDILEIWHDFLKASMDYAHTRSQWLLWESAERREKDEGRTAKHEIVIYNFKLLSRNMEQSSEVVNYLKEIENNRKQIGDFVSYLAYIYAINSR